MSFLNMFTAETISQILLVFLVGFYLFEVFAGYKAVKWMVAIAGFIVGFVVGFIFSSLVYYQNGYIPALIGILAGIIIALLSFKLYMAGVFIYCGGLAYIASSNLLIDNNKLLFIISAAAFIAVGILAVKFAKQCIILVTSIAGSINAVKLLESPIAVLEANTVLRLAVIVLIAATGILVQNLSSKNSR